MASITGIEIGPDYCVLLCARPRTSGLEVSCVRILEAPEWPAEPAERSRLLQTIREELDLPRRAAVVAWRRDAFSAASGESMLRQAGFRIDSFLSPCDALALVAWSRRQAADFRTSAWLSINRHGAAISVVRNLEVLYSNEFEWRIRASEQRVQAHVLRRYLYVAQLLPEIKRATATVRDQHGAELGLAVACGNIPDLRSFTMPLISELDMEIETLDSLDGLHVSDEAAAALVQHAAALRLAAAAASTRTSASVVDAGRLLGIAAGVVLLAGAAWWTFQMLPERTRERPRPDDRIVATQGRDTAPSPASSRIAEPVADSPPAAPSPTTGVVEGRPAVPSGPPLPPVPPVTGILISSDRRLAVIEGAVVGVGDSVAGRKVARIQTDAVFLREPSGREVRVAVRAHRQ